MIFGALRAPGIFCFSLGAPATLGAMYAEKACRKACEEKACQAAARSQNWTS
jgi:hypothetical protein